VTPALPFIPGHEGVGDVVATGAGVSHVKEGDRVGIPWLYTACGHCRHCLGGREPLCEQQQNTGYSVNGCFAEYVVADPDYVGRLPPGSFALPIFDTVLNGITVRGSIVGSRLDLQEALNFAGAGKVRATVATERLENINDIFARMHAGDIQGRIVIDFRNEASREGDAHG
jgi:D-arabinose 1-dehydrogenase-like Zn-dependent alcohol dehydrogenase